MSKFLFTPSLLAILLFSIVVVLMVSGCNTATLSSSAARIMDADMKMTENCQFVADVHGSSGWPSSLGMERAKNEAREIAAALGATHVVWTNIAGGERPFASGKIYICK